MLAAAKVIIRLTGLNEYAFSSGECPAAPAFQATRLRSKKDWCWDCSSPKLSKKNQKLWGVYWYSNKHALRNTKERNMRSKIRWFTEFCNSHYVSHFAAFFIDARAKRSVVESCILNCLFIIFFRQRVKRYGWCLANLHKEDRLTLHTRWIWI